MPVFNVQAVSKELQRIPLAQAPIDWLQTNWILVVNASSLVATTAVTSVLGFAYWWLVERLFSTEAFGFASAAVSAMMLLGAVGMLGLGTLLIGELPRQREKAGSIISAAIVLAGTASGIVGILFAFAAPSLSPELAPLSNSLPDALFFAVGVVFTAITLIVDQSLIGLLRGGLQLGRNTLFAVAKLVVLYLASVLVADATGLTVYVTWLLGNVISLVALAGYMVYKGIRIHHWPQWSLIKSMRRSALAHHAVNLILQAPSLIMPIAVTVLLSASSNASFYAAWMVVSFSFVIPSHLSTVLYAFGASDPSALMQKLRSTMKASFIVAVPLSVVLFLGAGFVLNLFGGHYADQAEWCLRILSLGIFPLIIKYHYIALLRVYNQLESSIALLLLGSTLEITFVIAGLKIGGLTGLSIGWLAAVSVESVYMYYRMSRQITAQTAVATVS